MIESMITSINMDDKKVFRDVYLNGEIDEYEMTFRELYNALPLDEAIAYWNGENPYEY